MKSAIKQNKAVKIVVQLLKPFYVFCKELFNAAQGRRLTVMWFAAFFIFMYISSQYYIKQLQSKVGIAVDISNISSNDHILFKVNKGITKYQDIRKGEYVAFKTDKLEPFVSRDYTIIKKVVGKHGDFIEIRGLDVLVNNKKYGELNPKALQKLHKSVSEMQTKYFVPANSLFVLGTYERSYDSRYWGVLTIAPSEKLDVATPILF